MHPVRPVAERAAPQGEKKSASGLSPFSRAYATLNAEQKRAVDTIEGPVMVVAGPGTGKTQVLGVRVANILQKTQARPSNILCLTFSNAGATAMRERLRGLIGGDAYAVTVDTVHGFCQKLIGRNTAIFEEWAARRALSDIERYRMLEGIIDACSDRCALINPKNPYERIPAILGRIGDCKREGKTLEELERVATQYDAAMAAKSRAGTKADAKNRLQATKFRDFIAIFRRYGEALRETGSYDYDDMILVVLQALAEDENLLASLQERYQYILVDEAQDLNGAQWKVIEALTTFAVAPHEPNFFLVGDDDQAIYRFQGANVEHMLAFRQRFTDAPIIVLTQSYRSTQTILDAAGRLIARNEERLIGRIPDLVKDLTAVTKEKGAPPLLLRPPSDAAEPWLIADLLAERIAAGISPDDIAVLVQTNAELRPIYDVLRARNVPVVLSGKADLLTHPLVEDVVSMLRFAGSPTDDHFLQALASPCFGCHPADLARVSWASRAAKSPVQELVSRIETAEIALSNLDALTRARDALLQLEQQANARTVLQTVENALRTSGMTAGASSLDPVDLAVVEAFFQYVKKRCLDQPDLSLAAFLADLRFYGEEAYREARLTYQLPHLVTTGVQLMTAHQSKGLEFHTVILSAFREGHWDERRNPQKLSLPEDLLFGWHTEQQTFEKHQDERRVAYVAMTRAKRELLIICPKEFSVGERARSVAPSAFFAEAGPLPEQDASLREPERSSLLLFDPPMSDDAATEAYLRERLKDFALSPSALTAFLRDPKEFRRVYLLGQPQEFDEKSLRALAYGSAVHWALRAWGEAKMHGKVFNEHQCMEAFAWHLTERNILTEKQRNDLLAHAREALPAYFTERLQTSNPFVYAIEREYRAHLGEIPIKGKIDRIDLASATSGVAVVIDYKTGKPKAPGTIRGGLESGVVSRTEDGDNFRQLVFYALLLQQAEPLLNPQAFTLEFIGERGEEPISRSFSVTEQEKDDLRGLIRDVWAKIITLDFSPLSE